MILLVLITGISMVSFAQTWQQTWSEMSKEEKMAKVNSFRADNQKFLKDSLGMTSTQLKEIDSLNVVFFKEMKLIERSPDSDDDKLAKAKELAVKRGAELDRIMGEDKHHRFTQYMYNKLQKAQG